MTFDSIQFLRALHGGADPEEFFQTLFQKSSNALGNGLRETAKGLIERQQNVQAQVIPVVKNVTSLDIVGPEQQRLEASQKQLGVLETIAKELTSRVAEKTKELEERKQSILALTTGLASLRKSEHVPPPTEGEAFIIQLGQHIGNNMGKK